MRKKCICDEAPSSEKSLNWEEGVELSGWGQGLHGTELKRYEEQSEGEVLQQDQEQKAVT